MHTDKDLFAEEQTMVAMSFGDHIEELRIRLVLGLIGLFVGMVVTFIPIPVIGQSIGSWVMDTMQEPARETLKKFYADQAERAATKNGERVAPTVHYRIPAADFLAALVKVAPKLKSSFLEPSEVAGTFVTLPVDANMGDEMRKDAAANIRQPFISLAPLETATIYFMVCMVVGLVLTSPWVFYQAWAFVGAGLYRHERHYVVKFLPFSLGLFLSGVFLCFFGVLPVTLGFLLQFNVWLGIEPTMRITDWMNFATILPLVFGLAFQTPLIMLFLERIGILTADDFRAKRKIAILVIVVAAAILTPGPDVFSQAALAVPMVALYELGIVMMGYNKKAALPANYS